MKSKKANMEMEQQIIYPKKKREIKVFDVILILFFILFIFLILIPLWKVLVDSFDLHTAYGMKLVPKNFGIEGYRNVFTNPTLYRPLIISVVTTIAGTLLGLTLSTLGAYVLIQRDAGKKLFGNMLLFTMIFQGGMIQLIGYQ